MSKAEAAAEAAAEANGLGKDDARCSEQRAASSEPSGEWDL